MLQVISRGVGVIGTSKGGDLALAMASFIPSVIACVTINCAHVVLRTGFRVGEHVYPGLRVDFMYQCHIKDDGAVQIQAHAFEEQVLKKSVIPVERSNAAFLFLVSNDDRNMSSEYFAQECRHRLSKHGYSKPYEVSSYPGAGHLLEPPYSPYCYASFQHASMFAIVWGGTVKHHTFGQVKAWSKMIEFFKHHIAQASSLKDSEENCTVCLKSNL